MRKLLLLTVVIITVLFACSGKDNLTVDKIPPIRPILIPHLGDWGDGPVEYNGQIIYLTDENNGIDALPDGNWIRVSWEHFLDTDLDYVRIFRFNEFNLTPVLIDSISSNNEFYSDSRASLDTHTRYSYFIEIIDNSGNSAISDTVSYALLSKQIPIAPINGSEANPSNITFEWQKSGEIDKFRILVLDENRFYMWHRDIPVATEGDFFDTALPNNLLHNYTGNFIYWRIDAFRWDHDLDFFIGSESYEQTLYLTGK